MSLDLSHFQEAFFAESSEHLTVMEEGLLQLERQPGDLDLLNRIFRSAHSIKGCAGMFGFTTVGEFTHKLENILDALRNSQMTADKPIIDLLLEATDGLKGLMEAVRSNSEPDEGVVGPLRVRLIQCMAGGAPAEAAKAPSPASAAAAAPAVPPTGDSRWFEIEWTPAPTLFQRGMDPMQIVRELRQLGELDVKVLGLDALPPLDQMDAERCYLAWKFSLTTSCTQKEVGAAFEFVAHDSKLSIKECGGLLVAPVPPAADTAVGEDGKKPLGAILVEEGTITPETLSHALAQQKRIGEILVEQKAVTPAQVTQALEKQQKAAPAKKAETTSIRVDTDKIDKLINLVGELVITQSMLSDLGARFTPDKLHVLQERITQLERNTREIQERVMAVRMLPIGTAFNRFPRLVRDLSAKNGKQIDLVLSGEETELDKTVIESIGDPLTHLVRNSADHGLEPPEERLAAGKSEKGTITMNAFHEGGNICITVGDDGRGLNREKILAKAVKNGLIGENDKLSDDQIWQLIFRPGFSTADAITDVSGRGVGMDVVKRNIEGLGGNIAIKTAAGKGTTFTLKLPLTLAIIDGMTVRVGAETYIVPLVSIVESLQAKAGSVKSVIGTGELLNVRGHYVPVVRLYEAFGVQPDCTDPYKGILVILETEGERVAVMVDELVGQQQVVIKSLERNFRKVDGIAGATILGDGTVGFILDVRGLLEVARQGDAVAA